MIGEVRYFGGSPFRDQAVHERCGECVSGSNRVGDMHGMARQFDIFVADQNRASSCAEGYADSLPAVAACSFAAEHFDGVRQSIEFLDAAAD